MTHLINSPKAPLKIAFFSLGFLLFFATINFLQPNKTINNTAALFVYSVAVYFVVSYYSFNLMHKIRKSPHLLLSISLTIVAIFLCFHQVIIHPGWPYNHEYLDFKKRTLMYVNYLNRFEIIPIWSSSDCFGMGSLLPLFYHKIYYYIAAIAYILTGHMKTAILGSLIFFSLVGVLGAYRFFRFLLLDRFAATLFSIPLIFLKYALTDWLVRGATAEYTAFMLIPWLFAWVAAFLKDNKFSYSIIFILFLLFHAHNVTAYYAVFILLLAFFINMHHQPLQNVYIFFKKGIIAAISFTALIGIHLLPMAVFKNIFDPATVTHEWHYQVYNNFRRNMFAYLYDKKYVWMEEWRRFTVETNLGLFVLTAALFIFILMIYRKQYISKKQHIYFSKTLCLLFFGLSFYLWLQFKVSTPFYKLMPGAEFIQFPWRLLVYIQFICLALAGLITSIIDKMYADNKIVRILPVILLCVVLIEYPGWRKIEYDWYSTEELEKIIPQDTEDTTLFGIGEYSPTLHNLTYPENREFYKKLAAEGVIITNANKKDVITPQNNNKIVPSERIYDVFLANSKEVILPINYSGKEIIYLRGQRFKRGIYRTGKDPRLRMQLPEGQYQLKVTFPTILTLLLD